jgi:hypothetical protein
MTCHRRFKGILAALSIASLTYGCAATIPHYSHVPGGTARDLREYKLTKHRVLWSENDPSHVVVNQTRYHYTEAPAYFEASGDTMSAARFRQGMRQGGFWRGLTLVPASLALCVGGGGLLISPDGPYKTYYLSSAVTGLLAWLLVRRMVDSWERDQFLIPACKDFNDYLQKDLNLENQALSK